MRFSPSEFMLCAELKDSEGEVAAACLMNVRREAELTDA